MEHLFGLRLGMSGDGQRAKWKLMFYWSFIFFSVALAAGLFGFGGSGTAAAGLAQTLFFVFLAAAVALVGVRIARDYSGSHEGIKEND